MSVYLISAVVFGMVVAAMAVGVMAGRPPIKGSCGGMGALGIDTACEMGLNHPLGPFKLLDFSGLDISYNAMMERYNKTKDPKDLPPRAIRDRVERGELGRKTGRGFYDYRK